jgi:hypothetical protein
MFVALAQLCPSLATAFPAESVGEMMSFEIQVQSVESLRWGFVGISPVALQLVLAIVNRLHAFHSA